MRPFGGANSDRECEQLIKEGLAGMHEYVHREMERLHQIHQLIILAESPSVNVGQMKEIFKGLKALSAKDWLSDA